MGAGIEWVMGSEGETVSSESYPVEEAKRLVAELISSGRAHDASWAPDHHDASRAWIYAELAEEA